MDLGLPKSEAIKVGRPRKHASNAAKNRDHRTRQGEAIRRKLLDEIRQLAQDHSVGGCGSTSLGEYRFETALDSNSHFVTQVYRGTIYKNIRSSNPFAYLSCAPDQIFIEFLRDCHFRDIEAKEENLLISPAIFDPNKDGSTGRGKANIVCVRDLWLDFENGEISPEEFAELFPMVEMLIFNSFNHTKRDPRFRVVMLTSQAVTADGYEAMFDMVELKLKDSGYATKPKNGTSFKKSGLDRSKRSATSLYCLPCQAKNPADSFAYHAHGPDRQPINPEVWIQHADLTPQQCDVLARSHESSDIDQAAVDRAITQWRESPACPGQGNDRFYSSALSLKESGDGCWRHSPYLDDRGDIWSITRRAAESDFQYYA